MRGHARKIGRGLWILATLAWRLPVALWRSITRIVGRDELTLIAGVVLVTVAIWPALGRLALLPAGLVLVWLGLPARASFIASADRRSRTPEQREDRQ